MRRPPDTRFDWLTVLPFWGPNDDGCEVLEVALSDFIHRSGMAETDWQFAFVSWASARLIQTGELYEIAAIRTRCGIGVAWIERAGINPCSQRPHQELSTTKTSTRRSIISAYDAIGPMQSDTHQLANYDWLLTWTDWFGRQDLRREAIFDLTAFLQRSHAHEATWSLDFLSWKYERLVVDGCWYEARLKHQFDCTKVHVIKD